MASTGGWQSFAIRLAELIESPLKRTNQKKRDKDKKRSLYGASDGRCGRCGRCPACHEFVYIEVPKPDSQARCPACRERIRFLDPLGPDAAE
jgi:hypothetical protein